MGELSAPSEGCKQAGSGDPSAPTAPHAQDYMSDEVKVTVSANENGVKTEVDQCPLKLDLKLRAVTNVM